MKTFLFTHTDLDGVGCAVVGTMACPELVVAHVHYQNVNQEINKLIDNLPNETVRVHITDICPEGEEGKEICEKLDALNNSNKIKLFLCDHHTSSAWVKKYAWAWHVVNEDVCGTTLYRDFLANSHMFSKAATEFAECVNVYDNWLLDHPLRPRAEDINSYLYFVGFDKFIHAFSHDPGADISPVPAAIIAQIKKNDTAYIKKIIDKQCIGDFALEDRDKNKYCVLFAESSSSQVCHAALDSFPELDYAMSVNVKNELVSLRSRENGTDVAAIAKRFGGGGRQQTAGFSMSLQNVLKLALKG